jgi:hypothetical protein
MNTAFSNWTSAKTANESNLTFTQISAIPGGTDIAFTIRINRMSMEAMPPGVSGFTHSQAPRSMDYNNDGQSDETRIMWGQIDIRQDLSGQPLTQDMAHEIGHFMGLDDCESCDATTVMSYRDTRPEGPATCDTNQVKTMFP